MPYYKSPQQLEGTGPNITFTPTQTYWINSYYIPPIDLGSTISLNVLSDREGKTAVLLAPWDDSEQAIVAPVLVNVVFASHQKGLAIFTSAKRAGPYLLTITSYNSTYTFYLTSTWSPFYGLKQLAVYSFLLLPLGAAVTYYSHLMESREKMEEEALAGIPKRLGKPTCINDLARQQTGRCLNAQ
jgi:hypothetical protein